MKPAIGQGQGTYNLVNIKVNRSYMVQVNAPDGYLFTSGVCNDDYPAFECEYFDAAPSDNGRNLRSLENTGGRTDGGYQGNNKSDNAPVNILLGIPKGRSSSCITVDREGLPDGQLNLGVMRIGDTREVETNVALVLDFDDATSATGRALKSMLDRATKVVEEDGRTRYLLRDQDKTAIGSVTAEVLASILDKRLSENAVELDAVSPKDVILSNKDSTLGSELAVALEVKGHYSPPPDLDFDYIVQDSINRDTETIRRGLRDYNQNCRDQTSKVQELGFSASDFSEVHSMTGSRPNRESGSDDVSSVYRTTCAAGDSLPEIFETSLKEIEARKVSEVQFSMDTAIYMNEESRLESWAMGPVAGLSGMIAMLMGVFVFRRALGPRRVDKFRDAKTKEIDVEESRRFGEMGGDMDDGSVDSAFYSDSDDDVEESEKEKKMRRKRKEKASQLKGGKSRRNVKRSRNVKANGKMDKLKSSFTGRGSGKAVSLGSDDTDSFEKSSNDSVDRSSEKKRSGDKKRSRDKKKSSSSGKSSKNIDEKKKSRRVRSSK
jgi:hypothetical protein